MSRPESAGSRTTALTISRRARSDDCVGDFERELTCTRTPRVADNAGMEAEAVVQALQSAALATVAEALAVAGVPSVPGFYAWWTTSTALPALPIRLDGPHGFGLLYVGIAPSRQSSAASLRSRVCRQHIRGNINASTFRFGLATLLWKQNGWQPLVTNSGRVRLASEDNVALSDWQRQHLRVSWAAVDDPWRYEREVVTILEPPMNREHNRAHPFYKAMGTARSAFRAAAVLQ